MLVQRRRGGESEGGEVERRMSLLQCQTCCAGVVGSV